VSEIKTEGKVFYHHFFPVFLLVTEEQMSDVQNCSGPRAVKNCSSCGENHESVEFVPLPEPKVIDGEVFEFRGECPKTGETLFMHVI
jgi:hypothetical protein